MPKKPTPEEMVYDWQSFQDGMPKGVMSDEGKAMLSRVLWAEAKLAEAVALMRDHDVYDDDGVGRCVYCGGLRFSSGCRKDCKLQAFLRSLE